MTVPPRATLHGPGDLGRGGFGMQLHDVAVERNVDTSLMRWPMRQILTGEDGADVNRLFCNLAGMPWAIVETLLEYEQPKVSAVGSGEAGTDDVF